MQCWQRTSIFFLVIPAAGRKQTYLAWPAFFFAVCCRTPTEPRSLGSWGVGELKLQCRSTPALGHGAERGGGGQPLNSPWAKPPLGEQAVTKLPPNLG